MNIIKNKHSITDKINVNKEDEIKWELFNKKAENESNNMIIFD